MFNRFCRWLVPKVADWCERTGRTLYITGTGGPEDVYLIRYFAFRSKYFSCYIHRFLRSDRDDPHDHPFSFLGYVVTKGYNEVIYKVRHSYGGKPYLMECPQPRSEGKWAWRNTQVIHKVLVDKDRKVPEKDEAPLTFIFRGPERKDWYFYRLSPVMRDYKSTKLYSFVAELWYDYLGLEKHSRE